MLFERLGVGANAASLLATIVAYAPKIPALLLTMALIERWGRRKLLQTFVPLMGACHLLLALAFGFLGSTAILPRIAAIAAISLYGVAFALSLGPIPNILTAELFPMRARSASMSVSLGAQFLFNTIVGFAFPILRYRLGTSAVFGGFSTVCFAAWLFVRRFVPETKGVSLEQLAKKQQ